MPSEWMAVSIRMRRSIPIRELKAQLGVIADVAPCRLTVDVWVVEEIRRP